MKIMTYNILGEDDTRTNDVLVAIKQQSPDFLAVQEANHFVKNGNKYLKEFSTQLGLPFFEISLATEYDYHVASFSKFPFKKVNKLKGFRNACLETVIDADFGEISICNVHLTPYTEAQRLVEIELVISQQTKHENKIILGDLNSLSLDDNYDTKTLMQNDSQRRKFAKNGELQFEVISQLKAAGYIDTALEFKINNQNTVPTPMSQDKDHGIMRLDYIFVSKLLIKKVKAVEVVKNEQTDQSSDHYPVMLVLG